MPYDQLAQRYPNDSAIILYNNQVMKFDTPKNEQSGKSAAPGGPYDMLANKKGYSDGIVINNNEVYKEQKEPLK